VSFLSNSAGYSTTDQDISVGREKAVDPAKSEAIISEMKSNEPAIIDQSFGETSPEGSSVRALTLEAGTLSAPKKLSVQSSAGDLPPKPDLLSMKSGTSQTQSNPQPQETMPQQSMFEIKSIVEKPIKSGFPEFPAILSQQPSPSPSRQIEQSDSLEERKLVAAFLEAPKKSVTPRSSLNVQKLSPQTSKGPLLMPPAIPVASPRRSEISLPPPEKPGYDASSAVSFPQSARQKPSFSRRKTPLHSKPSLHSTAKVSKQLLPALISPCAIALSEHAPVNKVLKTPEETSSRAKKFKPAPKAETVPVSITSARGSTSKEVASNLGVEPKPETRAQRSVAFSNADSVSRLRVPLETSGDDHILRARGPFSDTTIRPESPARDPVFPGKPNLEKAESVTIGGGKYAEHLRETRSEDAFSRGSPTRFRTYKPETGSTHSDWLAAHHKPVISKERVRFSDTVTTDRKASSTRYSKHKGFFVRQKPDVDKFQIILVDANEVEESVPNESREPLHGNKESKTLSHSALLESVTPAAAIALPQIISAQPLRPTDPSQQNMPQRIANQPDRSNPEVRSQENTRPRSKESAAVLKKTPSKPVRSKQSTYRIRTRMRKSSHAAMSTITDPLEFKFKGRRHDGIPHLRPARQQSTSSGLFSGTDRGFVPFPLDLKLTRSLPQATGSPSLSTLRHPNTVSKSLGELEAAPMALLTPKSSRVAYLKLPNDGSRYASQLLARDPTPVSSRTTQVEKGDIDNGTCDVEVQSTIRSFSSEQGIDEATSFGSLGESRQVPMPTAEMASQVSDIRTAPVERPTPRLQPFPLRSKLPALVRSPNPPRSEVSKGRGSKVIKSETPSRLPVPVKKKSAHRLKPEARAKSAVQKVTRSRAIRKPPVPCPRRDSGPKPSLTNPLEHGSLSLKSGTLRAANKNAEDTNETTALQDYDSHHVLSQTRVDIPFTGEVRPEAVQPDPSSGADPLAFLVEVQPEPTGATEEIVSITRTVSPAVLPEPSNPVACSTVGEEKTVTQSVKSDSPKTKLNQKTRRSPIRRSPASLPQSQSLKVESCVRGASPTKSPGKPSGPSDVFVFGGRRKSQPPSGNQCTPANPPRRSPCTLHPHSLLTGVTKFPSDIQEEQSLDFLQDDYKSVRGIPNVPWKREL